MEGAELDKAVAEAVGDGCDTDNEQAWYKPDSSYVDWAPFYPSTDMNDAMWAAKRVLDDAVYSRRQKFFAAIAEYASSSCGMDGVAAWPDVFGLMVHHGIMAECICHAILKVTAKCQLRVDKHYPS